jgi:hypothetical protein
MRKRISPASVLALIVALFVVLTGTATAAKLITGAQIKNGSIGLVDLNAKAKKALKGQRGPVGATGPQGPAGAAGPVGPAGASGAKGAQGDPGEDGADGLDGEKGDKGDKGDPGVANLETDGPYPGRPDTENLLQNLVGGWQENGAQSSVAWVEGGLQQSWVMCPQGKVALGGGFGDNDSQPELNFVTSAPVQIAVDESGPETTFAITYDPIADDTAGSFVPNGWLVEGYLTGAGEHIVRPWVVCAEVNG